MQIQCSNKINYGFASEMDSKKTTERKPDFSVASLLNLSLEEEDEDDDSTPSSKSQVIETSEVGQQKANNKKKKKELVLQCPKCNKTFNRNWLLKGHLRTHTGEKPFECNLCKKSFADKSNLRAHKQTHYAKSQECENCGKKFALKSYLKKHRHSACNRQKTCNQTVNNVISSTIETPALINFPTLYSPLSSANTSISSSTLLCNAQESTLLTQFSLPSVPTNRPEAGFPLTSSSFPLRSFLPPPLPYLAINALLSFFSFQSHYNGWLINN